MTMDEEGYMYQHKVNQTTQKHFEPLEIYYRVHNYAMKLLRKQRYDGSRSLDEKLKELRVCAAYLKVFLCRGVVKKAQQLLGDEERIGFKEEEKIKATVKKILNENEEIGLTKVEDYLSNNMLEYVSIQEQIEKLVTETYEAIASRFPHYKSFYRLAEYQYKELNKPDKALNYLFTKIFKKQPSRGTIFDVGL